MSNDVHVAKVSRIEQAPFSKVDMDNGRQRIIRTKVNHDRDIPPDLKTADDLSSPDHTQKETTESDNNISSCSTLDIINKVDNLSLQQLETKVRDLSLQLRCSEEHRLGVQRQLEECSVEKEQCSRRLDVVTAAHECRITEMHCVIAELTKKLRTKQESTIIEEQEPDDSEISFQEGSVFNSEQNFTNPDAECQTDPLDDDAACSIAECYNNADDMLRSDDHTEENKAHETKTRVKMETLQEEVLHLRAQVALLEAEITNSYHTEKERDSFECYDNDVGAKDVVRKYCIAEKHLYQKSNSAEDNTSPQSDLLVPSKHLKPIINPQKTVPIPKMAERIRLRCASKSGFDNAIAGDHLDNEIKNSNMPESVPDLTPKQSYVPPSHLDSELQRRAQQLEVRNTLLSLTLDECKEHCDHLYLLCGKYESNAIALQSAVNCSDRAIEAYDVMLALLESKLALIKDNSVAAEESRRSVESVARHLLDRLESEQNVCENSMGPWQYSFSIPDKVYAPWTLDDDNRLRYHVSKLKGHRSTVQNTIVNLESPFSDFYERTRLSLESNKELQNQEKSSQLDLEMTVLLQELLSLREENIALKTKATEAEHAHQHASNKINILQEALIQLQFAADVDAAALVQHDRLSFSEAEHAALTEQQLIEALSRESELKNRIQSLIASVTACQRTTDEKYDQLHNNLRELQCSNLNLTQLVDQNKRKYQLRIRKLEQRISEMTFELEQQSQNSGLIVSNVPETTL